MSKTVFPPLAHQVQVAAGSHPGHVRALNEDNVHVVVRASDKAECAALLIVADGMGGHKSGELASQLAVETIQSALSWLVDVPTTAFQDGLTPIPQIEPIHPPDNHIKYANVATYLEQQLALAVQSANQAIYQYSQDNPVSAGNLGTTVTCALIIGQQAIIANVGDSRTYHWRDNTLTLVTDDHSYVGQLVRMGQLAPEEIYTHPQRHLITRSLGHEPDIEVDVWTYTLEVGDRLLLCSDGLWEMVADSAEINRLLQTPDLDNAIDLLIKAANDNGGFDNISVALAELTPHS